MTQFETELLKELHNISESLDEIGECVAVLGWDREGTLGAEVPSGLSILKQIADVISSKK